MSDIDAQFAEFHRRNPQVLADLERLAAKLLERGRKRIGIKMIWEVLRYEHLTATSERYRLSNNYTSRYARLMIDRNPKLREVIELRHLKGEGAHDDLLGDTSDSDERNTSLNPVVLR